MEGYAVSWLREYDLELAEGMIFELFSYRPGEDALSIQRALGSGKWEAFEERDAPDPEAFRPLCQEGKNAFFGFLEPGVWKEKFVFIFRLLNRAEGKTWIPLGIETFRLPSGGFRILACRLPRKLQESDWETDFRAAYPVLFRLITGCACRAGIVIPGREHVMEALSSDYLNSLTLLDCIFRDRELPELNALMLVSAARYEGRSSFGAIAFLEEEAMLEEAADRHWIHFTDACGIEGVHARKLRKYLELSSVRTPLIAFLQKPEPGKRASWFESGRWEVTGLLGEGVGIREIPARALVIFTGVLRWVVVMRGGEAILFDGVEFHFRSREGVRDTTRAGIEHTGIFEKARMPALIRVIDVVRQQKKGTILIFSEMAEKEADRLGRCGRAIRVRPFDPDACRGQLMDLTGIDGAMLLDLSGICHAIGTLLDGEAIEHSNRARGARYNSTYTYIENQKKLGVKCLGLVISEDGMMDFVS